MELEAKDLRTAGMSLEDLQEVLEMYNSVTQKLQVSHEKLQAEVARLTMQLEEKNRELERKKRLAALGEMAAGIAHEIRNPLGGIQLYASTLAQEVMDRPLASELVCKISRGVKSLNALVTDMLGFTQNLEPEKKAERLQEIVTHAVELAGGSLQQHGVLVEQQHLTDVQVSVDGRLLGRVLLNLILNAAEAIGESGRKTGLIVVSAMKKKTATIVEVADDGPGIPAAALESIFNPFFTTKHTGTGLGLAIVHRIVEAHGGTITAENSAAGGARFKITLPD